MPFEVSPKRAKAEGFALPADTNFTELPQALLRRWCLPADRKPKAEAMSH